MEDIVSDDGKVVLSLADRLLGRYLAKDIVNEETGEVLARRNDFVDEALASKLDKAGIRLHIFVLILHVMLNQAYV